eukprot:scaffold9132_cov98-Cylindrotheca_fusiformis.AAC.2
MKSSSWISLIFVVLSCSYSPNQYSSLAQNSEFCRSLDWVDDEGADCSDYADNLDWCQVWGDYVHQGSSANEACCACGGGKRIVVDGPPTAAPSAAVVEGSKNCNLSPAIQIDDGLTLQNMVDYDQGTFTMKLVYQGLSWIGIGFENDGRPGKPNFAVIGRDLEGTTSVRKYVLNTANVDGSGVVQMPQGSQTLSNASFTQENGVSTLLFTKPLNEDYDVPAQVVNNQTTWVYAVGLPDNAWAGRHTIFGRFNLALTPCFQYEWEITNPSVQGGLIDENARNSKDNFEERPYKILWILHGAVLVVAWGILCPLAIAFAFLKNKTRTWFKYHQAINNATLLLTCIGILLAVIATYLDDGADHLATDHSWFGVGVFAAILVLILVAFVTPSLGRPFGKLPKKDKKKKNDKKKKDANKPDPKKERDVILGMGGNLEVLHPDSPHNPRNKNKKQQDLYSPRQEAPLMSNDEEEEDRRGVVQNRGCGCCAWIHRIVGYLAVGVAWYTCYSGMDLQKEQFRDMDWSFYYSIAAAVGIVFMILFLLLSCCMKDIVISNNTTEKGQPLASNAQESSPQRQRSIQNDDMTPPGDDDDSSSQSSYENKTMHDLEEPKGQRSPLRKTWNFDTCCL